MKPLMTVRQRILVAIGIALFAVVTLVWVPHLQEQGTEASLPPGHVLLRGGITGLPADRTRDTRILVRVEPWSRIPTLTVSTSDVAGAETKEDPGVLATVLPSGAYEADLTGLCAGIEGEAWIKLAVTHPLCIAASRRARVRLNSSGTGAVIHVDVELSTALDIVGTASGGGAEDTRISVFDLTEKLWITEEKEIPRYGDAGVAYPQETVAPDDQGAFRLRAAHDHLLLVLAHASERLPAWHVIEPTVQRSVDVGRLVLEPGEAVEGTLHAPAPLDDWSVSAWVSYPRGGLWLGTGPQVHYVWTRLGVEPMGQEVQVDAAGKFRIEGLPRGRVVVTPRLLPSARHRGWVTTPVTESAQKRVRAPTRDVELEVLASLLRVEMVEADGTPTMGNFRLQLGDRKPMEDQGSGWDGYLVPADERFRIAPGPDDRRFPAVEGTTAPAGEERAVSIHVEPRPEPGGVRFHLPAGGEFSRCVATWTRDGYAPTHGVMYSRSLDLSSGTGSLEDMPPGHYVFRVSPAEGGAGPRPGFWIGRPVETDIRPGEEADVEVPLEEGGRWEVLVTRADTGAFQRCWVELRLPSGEITYPTLFYRGAQPDESSVTSRTRGGNPNQGLDPLPAGTYTLRFLEDGFRTEERTLLIEPRKTARVEVELQPR